MATKNVEHFCFFLLFSSLKTLESYFKISLDFIFGRGGEQFLPVKKIQNGGRENSKINISFD